jgi:hypothetical protein
MGEAKSRADLHLFCKTSAFYSCIDACPASSPRLCKTELKEMSSKRYGGAPQTKKIRVAPARWRKSVKGRQDRLDLLVIGTWARPKSLIGGGRGRNRIRLRTYLQQATAQQMA